MPTTADPPPLLGAPLLGQPPAALERLVEAAGEPAYRARQVERWLYVRGVTDAAAMSDLPQRLRDALSAQPRRALPRLEEELVSSDGARKLLLRLHDGEGVESVLLPAGDQDWTLCLSSQVGCALGCLFCRTGEMGLVRNLSVDELLAQVLVGRARLSGDQRLRRLVFMGMGEPLLNLDALLVALGRLVGPKGMGFGAGRITVSTAGLPAQMVRLREALPVQLAVSLGGSTEEQRAHLMPYAHRRAALHELVEACRALPLQRRERITFEMVLVRGVNDSPADARRLLHLTRGIHCKFNLLPLNPLPGSPLRPPSAAALQAYQRALLDGRRPTSIRRSLGSDQLAACGQLATARRGGPRDDGA